MTYINDDLLSQEETLAREQLRQKRARYEEALRSGAAAPGGTIEKEFTAARGKYIIIKTEQARRKGRELTTRDISADPELAVPAATSRRGGGRGSPVPDSPTSTPETPPTPAISPAPEGTTLPAVPPQDSEPSEGHHYSPKTDSSSTSPSSYTVVQGDTLGKIAKQHAVTVTRLAEYNALSNGNKLTPGQVLKIPTP